MPDEIKAPAVDVPDDLINSFLDGKGGTGKLDTEVEPEDETDSGDEETDDGNSEDEEDGNEDEGDGEEEDEEGDDDGNEDEDSEEEDESETEGDDSEDTFLSKETLKKFQKQIDANPALKAVYKSMQRDYVQKTMAVAHKSKQYEQANAEYEEFAVSLEDVTDGGGRESFLIDAAIDNPQVFQRAFDRAAELLEDPDSKKKYERERDVDARDRKLRAEERTRAAERQETRVTEIRTSTEDLAAKFGIGNGRGVKVAKQYVANVMLQLRASKKDPLSITPEQIRAAVREAARDIREDREVVEDKTGKKIRKQNLERHQQEIRGSKKQPVRAKGRKAPSVSTTGLKPPKLKQGQDPLDARLDQLLSASDNR